MIQVILVRERRRQSGDGEQNVPSHAKCAQALARQVDDLMNEYAAAEQGERGDDEGGDASRRACGTREIQGDGAVGDREGQQKVRPVDQRVVREEILDDLPGLPQREPRTLAGVGCRRWTHGPSVTVW